MSPPDKRKAPEGTGADATTYSITSPNSNTNPTRTEGSSFGVMLDRPVTTSRTCEGFGCWYHVGTTVIWPLTWPFDAHLLDQGWQQTRGQQACPTGAMRAVKIDDDEMARMARGIRLLEIAGGVLGL